MQISEFFTGTLKDMIIHQLTRDFPLTAKEIYFCLKKQKNIHFTYQAVYKDLQEMVRDKILKKDSMKYLINDDWIIKMYSFAERLRRLNIQKNRLSTHGMLNEANGYNVYAFDPHILEFVDSVGEKAEEYASDGNCTIVAVGGGTFPGGARYFALALKSYLESKKKKILYTEIDRETLYIPRQFIKNKKLIIVDSSIYTGTTYRRIMNKLRILKTKCNLRDIKFATGYDMLGIADWSSNNPEKIQE